MWEQPDDVRQPYLDFLNVRPRLTYPAIALR